jgi:hypothetical protein
MINVRNLLMVAASTGSLAFFLSPAHSATCTPGANDGVWITSIDGSLYKEDATCETAFELDQASGQQTQAELEASLKNNDYFTLDTSTLNWTYLGKDESGPVGDGGSVSAEINGTSGNWTATFSKAVDWFVLVFKGGQTEFDTKLALFDENGTSFLGGFDTENLGLVNKKLEGQGLSNFQVAGVFVGNGGGVNGEIPVPAGLPLLLTAMGLGGLISWRKRKTA